MSLRSPSPAPSSMSSSSSSSSSAPARLAPRLAAVLVLAALPACGALTSIVPGGSSSSDTRSQPSTVAEREAAKAAEPASRFEQICARSAEAIGPAHDEKGDDTTLRGRRVVWRPVLQGAQRAQFVTLTAPKKVSFTKNDDERIPPHEIAPGEPLLILSCTTYGGEWVRLLTVDGIYDVSVRADEVVLDPPAFIWPPSIAPVLPAEGAPPKVVIGQAHPEDRAQVAGLDALQTKYGDCSVLATGECMAAEKKVLEGPWRADRDAAKRKACDAAADKVWAKCMSKAERKAHADGAKQVRALTEKRERAYFAEMKAKLQ